MQANADSEQEDPEVKLVYSGGLVFGEAAGTGNPFIFIKRGPLAGKIIYADHDPDVNMWHENAFADSVEHLLQQISLPPFKGLCNLCGADKIWFE